MFVITEKGITPMNTQSTESEPQDSQTKDTQQAAEKADMQLMNAFMARAGTLAEDPFFGGL